MIFIEPSITSNLLIQIKKTEMTQIVNRVANSSLITIDLNYIFEKEISNQIINFDLKIS